MTEPRLRVLHVFQPPDGGLPVHVRDLALGLAARGHEITCAGPADARVRADVVAAGIRYVELPIEGRMPAITADRVTYRVLRQLVDAFDLVHAHGQKAGFLGRAAARRARVPSVYTPHALVYRTQLERARATARVRAVAGRELERYLGRSTSALVAVSQAESADARRDRLVPDDRIHVVYNGADPDTQMAADPTLRKDVEGPLLGTVVGLRVQKGFPTLMDALSLLAERGQLPHYAIVGNGPLASDITGQIVARGLGERVRLLPFLRRPEAYLAGLDAFVLASYWESMPIAIVEAMWMGLPVIATDVGGNAEAVSHGETGLIVPPHDPARLADAIAALAADGELRARMGGAARERAAALFSLDGMVDATEHVYRAAVSTTRS